MNVLEITDENAEDFSAFIDEDTLEDLDRTFFRGIGVLDANGDPAGAMVFELENSENEEDTKSRIRILNAGSGEIKDTLLSEYGSVVSDEEVTESFYESADKDMAECLNAYGFSMEECESPDLVAGAEDVKKLGALFGSKKLPDYIKSISEISIIQFRTFIKNCLFKGRKGLLDDLAYIPKKWFEEDISSCVLTDDEVQGALLIRKTPSGLLYVMLYVAFGPDYQKNLSFMMAYSAIKTAELYPEAKVVIRRHNDMVRKLTDKIFAKNKGATVITGSRAE